MPKITAREVARRKAARRTKKALLWTGILAIVSAVAYGIATSSGVRYSERDLSVINFSALNDAQKKTALVAANAARCSCGCGLGLAECIVTDSTCPLRSSNITRIQQMVEGAKE